jgi:hypothetical protein
VAGRWREVSAGLIEVMVAAGPGHLLWPVRTMRSGAADGSRRHPAGGRVRARGAPCLEEEKKGARPTLVAESWPDPGGTALPD